MDMINWLSYLFMFWVFSLFIFIVVLLFIKVNELEMYVVYKRIVDGLFIVDIFVDG